MLDLDHIKKLSPGWLGAIAGAAAAGATIVPEHRILAALGFGGAMLFIALRLTPCCDGCAAGKGCGGDVAAPSAPTSSSGAVPEPTIRLADMFTDSGTVATAGRMCS